MILGLDTTTERLHLAVVREDRTWTRCVEAGVGRSHSERLVPGLEALLKEAGAGPKDLRGVVCCVGPGGFTSLRIGVATAEGLALTGLPTWGFSAFELRARALRESGVRGPVWILLDGQRSEAFFQRWEQGPTDAAHKRPIAELRHHLSGEAWWAPSAFAPKLDAIDPAARVLLQDEDVATLAGLAALTREAPQRDPEAPLHPFYLRETDAALNFPDAAAALPDALRKGIAR